VDEPLPDRRPSASFGPDRRLTAACGGGSLVALIVAFAVLDTAGRLLFVLVALLLIAYAVSDLVFTPRLVADSSGVTVRTPFGRSDLAWHQIDRIHADARQRYGLRSVTLEIDAGDELVVLSRRALGNDPEYVSDVVNSFAPQGG